MGEPWVWSPSLEPCSVECNWYYGTMAWCSQSWKRGVCCRGVCCEGYLLISTCHSTQHFPLDDHPINTGTAATAHSPLSTAYPFVFDWSSSAAFLSLTKQLIFHLSAMVAADAITWQVSARQITLVPGTAGTQIDHSIASSSSSTIAYLPKRIAPTAKANGNGHKGRADLSGQSGRRNNSIYYRIGSYGWGMGITGLYWV